MKKNQNIPPRPTPQEESILNKYFYLPGWQAEVIINRCQQIESAYIGVNETTEDGKVERESVLATVYGLPCIMGKEKKPATACFFIYYECRVYQTHNLNKTIELLNLLKKEFLRDRYDEEVDDQEWEKKEAEKAKKPKALKKAA